MDEQTRREIILDNYEHPYHKELMKDDSYEKINTRNESCIDDLDIQIKFNGNIIENIYFTGEACAISTSTTSIMSKLLEGKTINEALEIINNYQNMINEEEYSSDILNEANAFNEVYKQGNRKHCALLPWNGIKKLLESKLT